MKTIRILRESEHLPRSALGKFLNIEAATVEQYESDKINPSLSILLKIGDYFNFSIDYLLNEETSYPRHLKLITLANKFDKLELSQQRNHIQTTAVTFLSVAKNNTFTPYLDNIDIDLTADFHMNLSLIREYNKLNKTELGKSTGISSRMILGYEKNMIPSFDKLKKLSKKLNVSTHSLTTGKKLYFNFTDKHFQQTILSADHSLPLFEQKMLIHLMERLLQTSPHLA